MESSRVHLTAPHASPCGLFHPDAYVALHAHFSARPELRATPLLKAKGLAKTVGLKNLWIKDESARFDLPSFKGLGAGFAITQLLERGTIARGDTLVCASEGNHGRAVARAARTLGLQARVYVGSRVAASRADAIALEGAEVVRVAGTYDDAVRRAASDAGVGGWHVISDTGWNGYEEIPRLIMLGYSRMMDEAATAWEEKAPDVVLVQGGVGGLAAAVASWYAANTGIPRAKLVAVEPLHAACLMESAKVGHSVAVPGTLDTIMGGLRCGEVSEPALPAVLAGYSAYLAIDDVWTRRAMLRLARPAAKERAIACGPSGAAGVAALMALKDDPALAAARTALEIGEHTRAMVIVTEGVTEPDLYEEIVGGGGRARQR